MSTRGQKFDLVPEQLMDQLRQLLAQQEGPRQTPPRFEPIENEPKPWSVPPPGGFGALREQLRKAG